MEMVPEEPSLQEALQLVDDWDIDMAALFGLDHAPPPTTPLSVRPAPGKTKMRKAKADRLELLQELHELEQHLESSIRQRNVNAPVSLTGVFSNEWAEIAVRQRKQRVAVEVENHKLREVVESQLKLTRRAATLIDKVKAIDTALGSDPIVRMDMYKGPHIDHREQLLRLDNLSAEVNNLFSSGRFTGPNSDHVRDVTFQNLGQQGLMIELMVSWVLPFSVARVADVLWFHTTRMPRTERTTCTKDIFVAEDTLVSQFVSEAKTLGTIQADHFQSAIGATHGQMATRRGSARGNGSVLVVSNMAVKNLREDGSCKSVLQGDGLLLVEPVETCISRGGVLSRVKWCRRVRGSPPDESPGAMADFTRWAQSYTSPTNRDKWWRSIDSHLQAVENMLLA